ncbi:MAG: methyltransferase [Verrucomicrobiota bacterium]
MSAGGIFRNLEAWDPARLRKHLLKGGYHRGALEALGLPGHWMRSNVRAAALLGHAPEGSPVNTLIRLFTLGEPIDGDRALLALGDSIHGLLEIGFLEAGGGSIRSNYQIIPLAEGWVACDFLRRQGEGAEDFVMGVGPSSQLLASLTPPVEGRALELACGIGWLSGTLAKSGVSVVASDLNARALELGRFSARLGGIEGIDFRQGDGFATVAGETFDLIVANPPYVQSPGGTMIYKESAAGDPICARLLREVPAHLAPGGIAVVLINWTHAADDDWTESPLSWVPPEGMRRWLFQSDCSSPADYAWRWISNDPRFPGEPAATGEMQRWLAHYQAAGINRISGGFMILQRCEPGGEWTRTESRAAEAVDTAGGIEVLRVIHNHTWLASDPVLLDSRFTVPDGVRAELRMTLGADGWNRETIRLISPARLSYDGQIDENLLRLLALVREGKTPAAMVDELHTRPELAAIPDLPQRITELVRDLVYHGMLVPRISRSS